MDTTSQTTQMTLSDVPLSSLTSLYFRLHPPYKGRQHSEGPQMIEGDTVDLQGDLQNDCSSKLRIWNIGEGDGWETSDE